MDLWSKIRLEFQDYLEMAQSLRGYIFVGLYQDSRDSKENGDNGNA